MSTRIATRELRREPQPRRTSRPTAGGHGLDNAELWYRVRREAGLEDVRIHDLRHTMASHAVMNGVPVPVVSCMHGHSNVQMTLRHAHLADRDIVAAAERIGNAVGALMDIGGTGR